MPMHMESPKNIHPTEECNL